MLGLTRPHSNISGFLLSLQDFSTDKPMAWSHFNAEGDVEFKAVLFIPPKAPYELFENYYSQKAFLKLYVRRVFISDEFDELLPKYLSFLKVSTVTKLLESYVFLKLICSSKDFRNIVHWFKPSRGSLGSIIIRLTIGSVRFQGIVDSDTLPLNVSREMLQQHSSLKTIKKKLVRKALDMIRRIVEEDEDEKLDDKKTG